MDSNSDFLPDCWNDDERMGYLFSGFRENRQVNPRDWDNKLKFWSDLAVNSGRADKTIVLSLDGLSQKFRRKGVVPQCLNGVLKEMHRNGQIIRVDDLKASTTWLSWGVNTLIRRPLKWTVTSFFNRVDAPLEEEYVAVELLKENGEAFLKRHHQNVQCASTDHLVDYSTFKEECADLCCDETSFDLVLSYLQRNREILISTDDNTRVIKFSSKGQKVEPITPTELGTLRLKKTIISMQLTIERISTSIQQHASETRQCLKKGMRNSAKNALRKKKLAQKRLESTESTLDALQQLQDRLQSAESEKMVLDAYKAGAGALKKTFADNGLTPEAVDDAISDVQEVMEMCNEIDDSIVQGNKAIDDTVHFGADIVVDDLEAELESLIGDDGGSPVTKSSPSTADKLGFLLDLPDVPSTSPMAPRLCDREGSIQENLVSS